MNDFPRLFIKAVLMTMMSSIPYAYSSSQSSSPLVIGHRGACGHRPEHTLESYKLAIEMGADFVEPDLVSTKDHILIARHENEISGTTDVATKFPDRKTEKIVDGQKISGWFVEDFTLKEIKTLKAKERLEFRSHAYDGQFDIPTFEEIIKLVQKQSKLKKRPIGIYPETKHPSYFQSLKLPLEEPLVHLLKKYKFQSLVFIQSFELENLKKLKKMTTLPLIYLIDDPELIPYDHVLSKDPRTYQDMLKVENLKEISKTVSGIGPYKRYIIPADKNNNEAPETTLIKEAHALGLKVHPYTFRSESKYLLSNYKNDPENEYLRFYELGVDGLFTDFPDAAVKARKTYLAKLSAKSSSKNKELKK
jgi:glycerophosphoryl diester phosphodiesterase